MPLRAIIATINTAIGIFNTHSLIKITTNNMADINVSMTSFAYTPSKTIQSSSCLEDLAPFLPKEELERNMLIPPYNSI